MLKISDFKSELNKGDNLSDNIILCEGQYENAKLIFNEIKDHLDKTKLIISLSGGSGSGKSGISAILSDFLDENYIGNYVMSGDNYPIRIPSINDQERLMQGRIGGIKNLANNDLATEINNKVLTQLQLEGVDLDDYSVKKYPFLKYYKEGFRKALEDYLTTSNEQDFSLVNSILKDFKNNKDDIYIKKMGRNLEEIYFEKVDFSNINVLILDWTHALSDELENVDIKIMIQSTPSETKEGREKRNRGDAIDDPFINMVLSVEQEKLNVNSSMANIIITRDGKLVKPYGGNNEK